MQRPKPPTFRPTQLQLRGVSLVEPTGVKRAGPLTVTGDRVEWDRGDWGNRIADLPHDFALREVLETTDADAPALMSEWGLLARPGHEWDAHPYAEVMRRRHGETSTDRAVSLHTCVLYLRTLRVLARHYLAFVEGDDAAIVAAWVSEDLENNRPAVATAVRAWKQWGQHMNAALRGFSPRIELWVDDARLDVGDGRLGPETYEATVLQLAQIAADGKLRRCENCGRYFTRQRTNRRQYAGTEHSEGVKFCSRNCAKAFHERARRQKRREEARGESSNG